MRILVVEDNHRLNSSLASSLAHEGYSVDSAYDGQEGQDLAEMTAYDLMTCAAVAFIPRFCC